MEFFQETSPNKSINKKSARLKEGPIDLSNSQDLESNTLNPLYYGLENKMNACGRISNAGNELKELKNAYQDILLHTFEIINQQKQALESKEAYIQYQAQVIDQKNIEIAELKEQFLSQQTIEKSSMSYSIQGKDFAKRPLDFDQGMDSLALSMVSSPLSKLTAFNTPIPIEKLMEVESPMPDIILESLEDLKKDEVILSQELIQLEKALIKMKPALDPKNNNKSQSGLERKKAGNPSTSYSNLKLWKQQKQIEKELDLDKEIENTEKELGYDDFFSDSFCIKNTIKPPPPSSIPSKKVDLTVVRKDSGDSKLRVRTEESRPRAITLPSKSPEISNRGKIKREKNNDLQGLNISKEPKSAKEDNKNTSLGKTIIPYGYYNYSNLMPNKSDRAGTGAGKIIHISKSQILQNIQQDSSNKTVDSLNVTITKSSPLVDKDKMGGFINLSRGKNPIKERNPEQKSNISQIIKTENNSARGNSSQIGERLNTFDSLAQENSELYKDIQVLTTTNNKNIFRNLLNQAGFGIFPSSPTLPNKSNIKVSQSYNFAESKEIVLNLDLSSANIRSSGQVSLRSKQDSTRQGDRKPKMPNFNEYKMRDVHGRKFVLRDKTNDENVNKSVQLLRNGGVEEEKVLAAGKRSRYSEKSDEEVKNIENPVISEINFQKLKNPQSLFRKKTS